MSTLTVKAIEAPVGFDLQMPASAVVDGQALTAYRSEWPQLPSRKNIIINGGMQINQRLAVGSTVTTTGIKSTDRWSVLVTGATHTQGVVANSVADTLTTGASNALKQINTGTSSATSALAYNHYKIEAQDIRNCGWDYTSASSYVTLSFWVKSSLAGTFYSLIYLDPTDPGGPRQYSHPFTLSANTWTNVSFSIPGNANLEFDNDNDTGLQIFICAHLGTDYTSSSATDNAWVAYSLANTSDDYPQNWCNTASATWEITAVQLEVGSTATDFEHRSYGEELALCQRYYQKYENTGNINSNDGALFNTCAWGTTSTFSAFVYINPMRTSPSVGFSDTTANSLLLMVAGSATTPTSWGINNSSDTRFEITLNSSSLTAGEAGWVRLLANKFMYLDAEL